MNIWNPPNPEEMVCRESYALTNIGGFLVTDGDSVRVTLSAHLDQNDKVRGKEALLDLLEVNRQPGVYLWSVNDQRAQYSEQKFPILPDIHIDY